jgi:hypothetical protein
MLLTKSLKITIVFFNKAHFVVVSDRNFAIQMLTAILACDFNCFAWEEEESGIAIPNMDWEYMS